MAGQTYKSTSVDTNSQCKHYTGRGVVKFYESWAPLAQDMGVRVSLWQAFDEIAWHPFVTLDVKS